MGLACRRIKLGVTVEAGPVANIPISHRLGESPLTIVKSTMLPVADQQAGLGTETGSRGIS